MFKLQDECLRVGGLRV